MKFTKEQITKMVKEELTATLSEEPKVQTEQQERIQYRLAMARKVESAMDALREACEEFENTFEYQMAPTPEEAEMLEDSYLDIGEAYSDLMKADDNKINLRDVIERLNDELS
tara:strand:- start:205 stop:543 length:339 start_codon:yes stop_codon:yes gene_type:complete